MADHHIVHCDTGMELRGGQRQLLALARGLAARGHEQWVVCPEGSALERRAGADGLRVFTLPQHDPGHAHGIAWLRAALPPHPILHAHDGRGHTVAWLASLRRPCRRIAHRRVLFTPPRAAGGRLIYRAKYSYTCDAVIAISDFIRGILVDSGVPPTKIEVIPDGVETPEPWPIDGLRCRARERWGLPPAAFVAGCLGAWTWEKGHDVALEAASRLAAQSPEVQFLLARTGDTADDRSTGDEINVPPNVRIATAPEDLNQFFAALDLFVMPSRSEGLGSAALLAMARGVPVVASRVGGLAELIEQGKNGWLVAPGSAEAVVRATVEAASDAQRLERFALAAREKAGQYSVARMVERTERLYDRLMESASGAQ